MRVVEWEEEDESGARSFRMEDGGGANFRVRHPTK
jgi:hypothetical protein